MAETNISIPIPAAVEAPESRMVVAKQWRLIWWKFRRHRLAMIGREMGLTRERVRQIEVRAFEKLQEKMKQALAHKRAETLDAT